ncbi:kinase-like domain-containing protein [Mycena pura]|uniref:Kinase-like domain-containing protein n=1 Tax=Mycena pura TaxID=153505 RepID=A0AAD6YBV9_9AGAR|nr:kinase-like domain-containing protein [Mycena pura]
MLQLLLQFSRCVSLLLHDAESARCQLSRNIAQAVVVVLGAFKTSTPGLAIRLPPTKTLPLLLPATPTLLSGSHRHPVMFWIALFAALAMSLGLTCGALAKLDLQHTHAAPKTREQLSRHRRASLGALWAWRLAVPLFFKVISQRTRRHLADIKITATIPVLLVDKVCSIRKLREGPIFLAPAIFSLVLLCGALVKTRIQQAIHTILGRRACAHIKHLGEVFFVLVSDVNSGASTTFSFLWLAFESNQIFWSANVVKTSLRGLFSVKSTVPPVDRPHASVPENYDPLPGSIGFSDNKRASQTGPEVWRSSGWKVIKCFGLEPAIDPSWLKCIQHLGKGGYGQVIKADARGTEVAVKRIHKPKKRYPQAIWYHFFAEVTVHVCMHNHPAFPNLFGAFHDANYYYLVMECGRFCFADLNLSRRAVGYYGRQLVDGVQALHEQCILHLDIKPTNLVLGAGNRLLIIDYGLSVVFDKTLNPSDWPEWFALRKASAGHFPMLWADDDARNPHTANRVAGTPHFMCPLVELKIPYSYGVDLWSVGVTLYYWMTNKLPSFCATTGTFTESLEDHLSAAECDFFVKIFSYEKPKRFESWAELKHHPFWDTLSAGGGGSEREEP